MVGNCSRNGLKSPTRVHSSMGGVEVIEGQPTSENNVHSWASSRNSEVYSIANDTAHWVKPLHC